MLKKISLVTLGSLCVITLFSWIAYAKEENSRAARVRGLNDRILQIHGEMQGAAPNEEAILQSHAAAVIPERSEELRALLKENPQQALSLTFSPQLLADLTAKFPGAAPKLESRGKWSGPIYCFHGDDASLTHHESLITMHTGAETLEVYFAETIPSGLTSSVVLEVQGVRVGDRVAADGSTTLSSPTGQDCSTTGEQRIAVFLVTAPGVTPPAGVTRESVYGAFFGTGRSLDGFWREASYGQTYAAGNVFGWYTLSEPYTCATMDQALNEAIALASAEGANFQDYNRLFVIYPNVGCVAGFAQSGCSTRNSPSGSFTASAAYIAAEYMTGDQGVQLLTHEAGHNLGLLHSGTLGFGTEPLGPVGSAFTLSEFGDYWSTMGSQYLGIYPAPHMAKVLGWMTEGTDYQVVQHDGTWSLEPLEMNSAGLRALKIQRGTGNDAWLWVEYRQPIGNYDSTLMNQPFSGALIHYEEPTTGASTRLLDFSPDGSWNTWWSPALAAGQSWIDPYTNLSLSVLSATPAAMTLSVSYGATPCIRANPMVSVSPQNPSTTPGKSASYDISVTNKDSAGCPSSAFNLGSEEPSGWPTAFSATSLTLTPGQSGSVTMAKTPPVSTTPGTFSVDAKAANGMYTSAAAVNITVTAASNLAVTVSPSASVYNPRQTISMTAKVSAGSSPASRSSVSFMLTQPDGTQLVKVVRADSTGKAVWNYKLGPSAPLGSYTVVATATYNSQKVSSGMASFTVE